MTASFSYGVLHSLESICLHFYLTLPSPLGGRNYSRTLQMRETQGSDIQHCPRPQCGPGTQIPPFAFQGLLPLAIALAPVYRQDSGRVPMSPTLQLPQLCDNGLDLTISQVPARPLHFEFGFI